MPNSNQIALDAQDDVLVTQQRFIPTFEEAKGFLQAAMDRGAEQEEQQQRDRDRQMRIRDLQDQVMAIRNPVKRAEAEAQLQQAAATGGSLSVVKQNINNHQQAENEKEGKQIQRAAFAAIIPAAALAGLMEFGNQFNRQGKAMLDAGIERVADVGSAPLATEVGGPGMEIVMMKDLSKGQGAGLPGRSLSGSSA